MAQYEPQEVRQVINPATARLMVEALETVLTPEGTAPEAAMTNYTVAGKTGTAQKRSENGYTPSIILLVIHWIFPGGQSAALHFGCDGRAKEGYYGGQVCGPVFKEVAERCASYLNIPSDKNLESPASSSSLVAAGVSKPLANARNP